MTESRWSQRHAQHSSTCLECERVIWKCGCASCAPGAPKWRSPSRYQVWQAYGTAVHPQCWNRLYRRSKLDEAAAARPMRPMTPAVAPPICREEVTFVKGEDGATIRLEDVQRQERSASQDQ